jgi:hypothetical protein
VFIMFDKFAALALALAAAVPAFAGDTLMTRPIEAGSIATEDLNLVAYYVPLADDGYAVTATWIAEGETEASRMTMRLESGDAVTFSLPGHLDTRFTFARQDEVVRVTSTPVVTKFEAASL